MKNKFNFLSRSEALNDLWSRRDEFEKNDKLEEFEALEKEIKEVPTLTVDMVFEPNQKETLELLERTRKIFDFDVFLDLRINPSLIGGCVLVWNGMVFDYSIKKAMKEKRPEFKQLIAWK